MLERHTGQSIGSKRLIAEGILKGAQVTVEGYAFGGKASVMGIVNSIMFPGTIAFSRFDYPSRLPEDVQAHMADIAVALMQGLGFDNGLFNIEMMYDSDTGRIAIIEINPRMASQFADLYEKVDGTSSYQVLLDIAEGRAPRFTRRQGRYTFAASCVLRAFADHRVPRHPMLAISRARLYPDIRVELHATVGRSSQTSSRTATATVTASSISAPVTSPRCSRHSRRSGAHSAFSLAADRERPLNRLSCS